MKKLEAKNFLEQYEQMSQVISDISKEAKKIINKVFGDDILLPIDVRKIAEYYGVNIVETDLSIIPHIPTNRVLGHLVHRDSTYYIEIERRVDSFTQRYSIAHELGHYIIDMEKDNDKRGMSIDETYSMPLLSSDPEEYMADVYAIFLLLPLDCFFKEFSNFLNDYADNGLPYSNKYPVNIDDWLLKLSKKVEIPNYNLAFAYDYIRAAAYQHYESIKKKSIFEQFKQYAYLFM